MILLLTGVLATLAAPMVASAPLTESAHAAGERVYRAFCATCHGARGEGAGPSARFLDSRPRDFTSEEIEFTTVAYGTAPRVQDVERTVTAGLVGTPMPSFAKVLTRAEIRAVSTYVLGLASKPLPASIPVELPTLSQDSPEARQRGTEVYASAGCVLCHGPDGRGDGAAASTLVTSRGAPIRPADLTRGVFKSGRGAETVYRVVSTGLPGTPMPPYARGLSVEQRSDLAHYVASLAQSPSWFARLWSYVVTDPAGRRSVP